MTARTLFCGAICFALTLIAGFVSAEPIKINEVRHDGPVDFQKEVLPVLRRNCLACHNASEAESDLVLETPATMLKGGSLGPAIVAGKGAESLMLQVAAHQAEPVMPPEENEVGAKNLTPDELGLLKLWIDQGAKAAGSSGPVEYAWQPLPPGVNPIYATAVTPDGQYAAAGRANQIFLYHLSSQQALGRLTDPALLESKVYDQPGVAHLDIVQSLAFSPDGTRLASGGFRTVKLWRKTDARVGEWSGLNATVNAAALSPNGAVAAFGQDNGQIALLDAKSGKPLQTFKAHEGQVHAVAFVDDNQLIAVGQDKTLSRWQASDGAAQGRFELPTLALSVAVVAEGQQIATGHDDNKIRLWSPAVFQPEAEKAEPAEGETDPTEPLRELAGHNGHVTVLVPLDAAGAQLVSGSLDSTIRIWTVDNGGTIRSMNHGGQISDIAVSPDGSKLVSASDNKVAKLWNAGNGQQIAELKGDFRAQLAYEAAARTAGVAKRYADNAKKDVEEAEKRLKQEQENQKKAEETVKTTEEDFKKKEEAAKKPVEEFEKAKKELEQAQMELTMAEDAKAKAEEQFKALEEALTAARKKLSEAGDDENAKKAAEEAAQKADEARKQAEEERNNANQGFSEAQNKFRQAESQVKKTENPAQKALDDKNSALRAFEAAQRSVERAKESVAKAQDAVPAAEQVHKALLDRQATEEKSRDELQGGFNASMQPLAAAAFSADGSLAATAGEGGTLLIWDAATGAPVESFAGDGNVGAVLGVGTTFVAAADKTAVAWQPLAPWELERVIGDIDDPGQLVDRVLAIDFSPDGQLLATGSGEPSRSGELKIWNAESGSLVREIQEAHSDTICDVSFSPTGERLATCGTDRFAKIFEVDSGKFVRALEGHTHHVLSVDWQADGRVVATAGADTVVKVWNALTGDQIRTIQGFGKEVAALRFFQDPARIERFIAVGGGREVRQHRADNGGRERDFGGSTDFVYAVSISDDGNFVVAGGADSVLRVWNGQNGQSIATFEPPAEDTVETSN